MDDIAQFDFPTDSPKIIKVIGVGGGGGNAVNHMYREGIHDVTFVLCNTDNQALKDSPVPVKLQLGKEGLGAGNRPARARKAAEESIEDIKAMLNDGTKMVFITAGMGGGTGTGAAPIIAQTAKEMDILTIGIVTIPFRWEGDKKIDQALDGVEEISKHVDALLVINNEKLSEIYSELSVDDAFDKADDTLSVAAKSIAEIITLHGKVNLDFNDVKTVLKDGGVAIMSTGYGEGDNRVSEAIKNAPALAVAEQQRHFQFQEGTPQHLLQLTIQADDERNGRGKGIHEPFQPRLRDQIRYGRGRQTRAKSQDHPACHRFRHPGHPHERDGRPHHPAYRRRAEAPCRTGGRRGTETQPPRSVLRQGCQRPFPAQPPSPYLYLQPRRPGQRRHHQHGRDSPTYLRDKSTLNSIKMKAEQEGQLATEAAQEAEGGAGGVITF